MKKTKMFALSLVLALQMLPFVANAAKRCGCTVFLDGTAEVRYAFEEGDKYASGQTYINGKSTGESWKVLTTDVPCKVTCN